MAVLTSLAVTTPRDVRELNPTLPPEVGELIMRLLEKGPAERPQSAADVVRRFQSIERARTNAGPGDLEDEPEAEAIVSTVILPPSPAPVVVPPPLPSIVPPRRRRRLPVAVAVMLLGVLGLGRGCTAADTAGAGTITRSDRGR